MSRRTDAYSRDVCSDLVPALLQAVLAPGTSSLALSGVARHCARRVASNRMVTAEAPIRSAAIAPYPARPRSPPDDTETSDC